jgi:methylase of polypeptide subunit release factors
MPAQVIEFGAGDGAPVLSALLKAPHFRGSIQGFELNPASAQLAAGRAQQLGLSDRCAPWLGQAAAHSWPLNGPTLWLDAAGWQA